MKIKEDMPIQDLLHSYPETYGIIIKHGLLPCCGKNPTIKKAVEDAGLDLDNILEELNNVVEEST